MPTVDVFKNSKSIATVTFQRQFMILENTEGDLRWEVEDELRKPGGGIIRWRDSSLRPEGGVKSHYGRCDLVVRGKSIEVHLFDLPMSLLPDFDLNDLIFPVEIRGCLLFANQETDPSTWRKDRFPGWLDWIQTQKTTFLVVVTGSDSPALPVDEFLGYLSLRPETQVLELSSHHVATSRLDHVFEMAEAKRVLTTLVENIATDAP